METQKKLNGPQSSINPQTPLSTKKNEGETEGETSMSDENGLDVVGSNGKIMQTPTSSDAAMADGNGNDGTHSKEPTNMQMEVVATDEAQVTEVEDGVLSDGEVVNPITYSTPDGKRHRLSKDSGPTPAPTVGMIFSSWEAVETYFRSYAKQQGFGIVRASSAYRQRNGVTTKERRSVTWQCERFGNKDTRRRVNESRVKLNAVASKDVKFVTRKSKKCQCPVLVSASGTKDGEWVVRRVMLDHFGHSPTPNKSRHVSMFRRDEITPAVRKKLFNDIEVGVKLPQIHRALANERNGLENTAFTERDLRNVLAKDRKLKMDMERGDANAMLNYFKKMADDNENFFHAERVDASDRLKDVMWVDARSRAAYSEFGDVVVFDKTYITNEFELPFANFVGVNHHGQPVLFGCALLSHEDSETFEWLFRTWLTCMGGHVPHGFLTDQCLAMRKAIAIVMPECRHRWCLWHILTKFSSKLGAYSKYEEIKEELHNAVYDSLTGEEFESNWCAVIEKFNLEANDWLEGT